MVTVSGMGPNGHRGQYYNSLTEYDVLYTTDGINLIEREAWMPTLDMYQWWVAILKGYILRRDVTIIDSQDTLQYYGGMLQD